MVGMATNSAIFGTVTYVVVLMTLIEYTGEAGARGTNGLNMFAFLIFPFVIPITLLVAYIMSKFISDRRRLENTLYKIAVVSGLLLGVVQGVLFR